MPERESPPWWSADDDEFAGATPLFDGERRSRPGEDQADSGPAEDSADGFAGAESDVGTPIGEALKLAAAVAEWSQKSGLTDTLKELAAEAADALASARTAESPEAPEGARILHIVTGEGDDQGDPTMPIVVCDYCPLCRSVGVMRTVRPQMSQGLAEAMASLTSALNTAVESFAERRRHR